MTAAGVTVLCCGSVTVGGRNPEVAVSQVVQDKDPLAAGLAALKAGEYVRAEAMFTRAGDDVRTAETFILQRRYDEAEALLAHKEDGRAKLMMALVCRGRGDDAGYRRHLTQAANLGNAVAESLVYAGA